MTIRIASDAARRIADRVTQASRDGHQGHWIAVRLSDGHCHPEHFLWRSDAVKAYDQHHMYIVVPPDGMSPSEAETTLRWHRDLHDAGYTTADPNFTPLPSSFSRGPLGL